MMMNLNDFGAPEVYGKTARKAIPPTERLFTAT
jgi:hypothetical protein